MDDLKQNGTVVPYDLPITLINAVWYGVLNSFKSASPVMFAMQNLHDMQVALSSDLYFTVISYALFETVLFNTTLTQNYLASIGLNDSQIEEVQTDEKYGWGSFETSKIWVQAYFDYNLSSSLDFGAFDILRNYFQISILSFAITPNGLISDSIQGILIDMVNRYGSENSTILGALQWANASLTLTPPLGLPPIQSSKFPFPSFASYNSTLDFPPEIKWLFPLLNITNLDFSPYAQSLLQVVYTYPNYNFQSIINIENLGFFLQNLILGNYTAIMQQ